MVIINKIVERVTAEEANLTFPAISLDITTETVAEGTANIVTATCMEEKGTPALCSKNNATPGSNSSFITEDKKSHIRCLAGSDTDSDAPMIKRAIGRDISDTIFSELCMNPGSFRLKKENNIPMNAEIIMGFTVTP
jgi:hypothetical protein